MGYMETQAIYGDRMSLELWPQITYLVLIGWGLKIQYKAGMKLFKKTLISASVLCFLLYFGGYFDTLITATNSIFGGHDEV